MRDWGGGGGNKRGNSTDAYPWTLELEKIFFFHSVFSKQGVYFIGGGECCMQEGMVLYERRLKKPVPETGGI